MANKNDADAVLKILKEFSDFLLSNNPKDLYKSNFPYESCKKLYARVIRDKNYAFIMALEGETPNGIIELQTVIHFRKAQFYTEIKSLYVKPEFWGKSVAFSLINEAVDWSKKNGSVALRLYSGFELERAHNFYQKMGFKKVGINLVKYF